MDYINDLDYHIYYTDKKNIDYFFELDPIFTTFRDTLVDCDFSWPEHKMLDYFNKAMRYATLLHSLKHPELNCHFVKIETWTESCMAAILLKSIPSEEQSDNLEKCVSNIEQQLHSFLVDMSLGYPIGMNLFPILNKEEMSIDFKFEAKLNLKSIPLTPQFFSTITDDFDYDRIKELLDIFPYKEDKKSLLHEIDKAHDLWFRPGAPAIPIGPFYSPTDPDELPF